MSPPDSWDRCYDTPSESLEVWVVGYTEYRVIVDVRRSQKNVDGLIVGDHHHCHETLLLLLVLLYWLTNRAAPNTLAINTCAHLSATSVWFDTNDQMTRLNAFVQHKKRAKFSHVPQHFRGAAAVGCVQVYNRPRPRA